MPKDQYERLAIFMINGTRLNTLNEKQYIPQINFLIENQTWRTKRLQKVTGLPEKAIRNFKKFVKTHVIYQHRWKNV